MKKHRRINKNKGDDIRKFWLRLWKMIAPSQKQIKKLLVLILFFESSRLIAPYILKLIIDKLTNFNQEELIIVIYLVILMLLTEQAVAFIDYFLDKSIFKILIAIGYYLPIEAHKKLMYLSLGYHEGEDTGNKIIKIERGLNRINDLLANTFWEVAPTLIQLVVTLVVLFFVEWRFGLSLLIFAPVFIFITYKINKDLQPLRKKRHEDYEVASGKMAESIININAVQSFSQEEKEIKRFGKIKNEIRKNEFIEFFSMLKFSFGRSTIINLGRFTILVLGAYLIYSGNITIGTLVFVITLSEKSYFSLWRLSRFYDRVEEGAEAVNRLLKLMNRKEQIINPEKGLKPKNIIGQIEFKKVDFTYKDSINKALDKVSLKINSGCVTALVGPSGGGKTTVARMVYRHYDPQAGSVLLDDRNVKDYDLYGFRKFIAIVPQEVEIFNTSVRDNISYANPRASQAEIEAAARIANAEEFIDKLAHGYNTLVGERGIKLSGGQRQRVGIARAVLANPRILIFDEATSNLDSYSEKLIQEAIEKIRKGRTMIIIAHRLSTIKRADKIIVLEDGKVAEQGSHYELAQARGGLYAKLLKLQKVGDVG
ncbi:MAG: ABC transporter ATP-binding protein [Patescibacteria group bacterium]